MADNVKDFIADHGTDLQYGARPLRRAIQTYMEDGISELLINSEVEPGATIHVKIDENDKDKLSFTAQSSPEVIS